MKIYRRVIPKIAKDIIRSLLANRAIEVEDGHRDEAELDLAGVFVDYMNELDKLRHDAQEALERHKLPVEMMARVRQTMAEQRKMVVGEGAFEHVVDRVLSSLFNSRH